MKKILIFSLFIYISICSFSQYKISKNEFSYLVVENNDSIHIRILPNESKSLNLLVKNQIQLQLKNTNNQILAEFNEASTTEKLKNTSLWDEKSIGIIESFILSKEEMTVNFTFAMFLIGVGYDYNLSKLSNTLFSFPIPKNTSQYVLEVKIGSITDKIEFSQSDLKNNNQKVELSGEAYHQNSVIYWDALKYQSNYSGHIIQKSYDSINFKTLNKVPYVHLISQDEKKDKLAYYQDSTQEENGATAYFRILSIDYFTKFKDTSNIVSIYFNKKIDGDLFIDTIYSDNLDRIIHAKIYPREENFQNSIKEYILFQSDSVLGPFQKIESLSSNELEVNLKFKEKISSGDKNFFKVAAVSVDNDTIFSPPRYYFTFDQIPPHQPLGLKGQIDSIGIVRLEWEANQDKDLQGYRIFAANHKDEEFVELKENFIHELNFKDSLSLNNLTKERYYFLIATDINYNNSTPSDTILILKPDYIPPISCLIDKFELKENGILIFWNNSNSDDVADNFILRIHHETYKTDTVFTWTNQTQNYLDTNTIIGHHYTYYILTNDDSGNQSSSEKLPISFELGYRPAPKSLNGKVDKENKLIKLEWENPNLEIYSIQIYRKKDDGTYILLQTLFENVNDYSDENISPNQKYTYKIKLQTKSGHHSKFSEEINVEF